VFEKSAGSASYDGAPLGLEIPAGSGWKTTKRGYELKPKTGGEGRTRIVVEARGRDLALPSLPLDLSSPLLVQLRAASGACRQSVHASAATNTSTRFTSRTGSP
jgi:hypothetical protein